MLARAVVLVPLPVGAAMVRVGVPVQFPSPLSVIVPIVSPLRVAVALRVDGHAALRVTFGAIIYPLPGLVIFGVRELHLINMVAVAFDVGAGMVNVGRVVHFPVKLICVRVPFFICVVAVNHPGHRPPVAVIFGG